MKPFLRVSMVLGCLAMLFWGGIAAAEEFSPTPESCEYLMKVVGAIPDPSCERYGIPGAAEVVACDQMDAATARAAGCPEVVALPDPGTYEYSVAMDTGSLPSTCADKLCTPEAFTILESGGIPYRLEVDFGGN
jgi:hypothetical protein